MNINIHRNFYSDNILNQVSLLNPKDFKNLPYSDNLPIFNYNGVTLYFIDLDRFKNLNKIKIDIKKLKSHNSFNILVLVSKSRKYLEKFYKKINNELLNIVIINIYDLDVDKVIDIKREKILHNYLTVETQNKLAEMINQILNLHINNDIRLVCIDLDNTLWEGIVGEDGIKKIKVNEFQKKSVGLLDNFLNKGNLVSIHSKNDKDLACECIKKKFYKYKNFIKKSFKYISWDSKITTIKWVSKLVNFSPKNIIFLDDNPSEIKQVETYLGKNNTILIKNSFYLYNYVKTINYINRNNNINKKRFKDISSNVERTNITKNKGLINYIKESHLKIIVGIKKIDLNRCAELSNKTNQFNANYKRYNLKQIKLIVKNKNYKIITFSVKDKYSNSGIIALFILKNIKNNNYRIEELNISCRALGRGLEEYFVNYLINKFKINALSIEYIKTKRNTPFIKFVESIKKKNNQNEYLINTKKIKNKIKNYEKYINTTII